MHNLQEFQLFRLMQPLLTQTMGCLQRVLSHKYIRMPGQLPPILWNQMLEIVITYQYKFKMRYIKRLFRKLLKLIYSTNLSSYHCIRKIPRCNHSGNANRHSYCDNFFRISRTRNCLKKNQFRIFHNIKNLIWISFISFDETELFQNTHVSIISFSFFRKPF